MTLLYYCDIKNHCDMQTGKWSRLTLESDESITTCHPQLQVPIIQGKNVIITIRGVETVKPINFEENLLSETFPPSNPLMGDENLESKDGNHIFSSRYSSEINPDLGAFDDAVAYTPARIKELYVHDVHMENIIQLIRVDNSFGETLRRIYNFTKNACSGEDIDDPDNECNLDYLIREFEANGNIPGDCKDVSTFVVGIANAFGLASRRVGGRIQNLSKTIYGHVWAEVFVPKKDGVGFWVPVDPAFGHIKSFPRGDVRYIAFGDLPKTDSPDLEIKVEYR